MKNRKQRTSLLPFLSWTAAAVIIGLAAGLMGTAFHKALDWATETRQAAPWLLYGMPLGAAVIAAVYHLFGKDRDRGTDGVLLAIMDGTPMSWRTAPMIFFSTFLTHLLGGSAGREGAALQLGGSLGSVAGQALGLSPTSRKTFVLCGAAGCFSALFGTPVAAAVFILEFTTVGTMCYGALVPTVISALTASLVAEGFSVAPTRFSVALPAMTVPGLGRAVILGALLAAVGILFCLVMEHTAEILKKALKNRYVRAAAGAGLVILLTLLVGNRDYNGASAGLLAEAIGGRAKWYSFLLKLLFTAITLGAGMKGGEIVPTFVVGATFGCVAGPLLGLDAGFAASLGMIGVFCAVTNCPIASILLGLESFGGGVGYFAAVCAVSFMLSGYYSLYARQTFRYRKTAATLLS